MSRGPLEWLITIPASGMPPCDGMVPALIQWRGAQRPPDMLEDRGCSLAGVEVFHPEPERVSRALASLGLAGEVAVHGLTAGLRPHLLAHIETPAGPRTLGEG